MFGAFKDARFCVIAAIPLSHSDFFSTCLSSLASSVPQKFLTETRRNALQTSFGLLLLRSTWKGAAQQLMRFISGTYRIVNYLSAEVFKLVLENGSLRLNIL